jgi:hypothetical protein
MSFISRSRPSPAMVVATVALSFALVGTAIAGPSALTSAVSKSQVKKIAKKQANKAIDQREAGLNVNSATTARSATTAETAQRAQTATTADRATTADSATTAGSAPPSGPAGGDLTGDYPNPGLGADTVGSSELKGTYAAVSAGTPAAANTFVDATAACNAGDALLGGGFAWLADADEIETVYSTPDPFPNPTQWIVRSRSGDANTLFAWAVCLAT